MELILGLIFLAAALLVLAIPLFQERPRPFLAMGDAGGDLLAQRNGLYATLRDLDLDYQLGKLDAADYSERREKYLARASTILRQLDLARPPVGTESNVDSELEREIATFRRPSANTHDPADRACPNCGRVYNEGDRFCARCGHTLS